MRHLGGRLGGWTVVVVGAVTTGALAFVTKSWSSAAAAAGATAAVSIVVAVWTSRGANAVAQRDEQHHELPGLILLDRRGRPPRVRELDDPVLLGAHPAARLGGHGRALAFIPRDISQSLHDAIRSDRFVLLVGESTAGKTRAAYEAMRTLFPDHRVVQPSGKEAIDVAVRVMRETPSSVLWLDDLERFLGPDGLTGAAVNSVLDAPGPPRFVLATMRSEEYAKYTGKASIDDSLGRDAVRRGWEVVRLATRLTIDRVWSRGELRRAMAHRSDPRIDDALDHSDRFGVAEYLAAGPQLLADLRDAWAPSSHPRGAALVLAAVDARRVGIHRPLPPSLLARLHKPYLARRGGELLRPERLEEALRWATTPLHAASSLLLPATNGEFVAFDYLIDAVEKDPIPPDALSTLLTGATPEEAMEIGETAWGWHQLDVAEDSFRQAREAGHVPGVIRQSHLIRERDGTAAGLQFALRMLAEYEKTRGPDHPDTLDVADLVGWETGNAGDPEAALRLLSELLPRARNVLGGDHKITLEIRNGIAHWTGDSGKYARAAELYADMIADTTRVLGLDDKLTIASRDSQASVIGRGGDHRRAVRMLNELLEDMAELRQHPHDLWSTRCRIAHQLTDADDHVEALPLWERLADEAATYFGRAHIKTFRTRAEYACCVGAAGEPDRAVHLLREIVADASFSDSLGSTKVLGLRRQLATWVGEAGDPNEARQQFEELVVVATEQRGGDDYWTLSLRRHLAHWEGQSGNSAAAVHQLEQLSADATGDKPLEEKIRQSLIHWRNILRQRRS